MSDPAPIPAPGQDEFIRLYTQAYPAVYGFIVSILAGSLEADDLMQQTSVVLWRKFPEFVAGSNFTAWAFQVARFEVLNHLRARSRDRHVFSEDIVHEFAAEHEGEVERLEAERRALEECLRKLPRRDRRLLRDCYADLATLKEVAARAGRTANSLYKWLDRVREGLLRCIDYRLKEAQGA